MSSAAVSLEMLAAQLSSSLAMVNEIKAGLRECQQDCNALRLLELSTLSASIPSSLAEASSHLSLLSSQASSLLAALPATYGGACASYQAQARRLGSSSLHSDSDSDSDVDADERKPVLPPWFAQPTAGRQPAHGLASPSPSPPPEAFRALAGAPYSRPQGRRKSFPPKALKPVVKKEPVELDFPSHSASKLSASAGPGPERRRRFAGGVAKSLEQRRRELGRL